MATLELAIDARPMVQGAQQAQQALDGVAKTAQATTKEVEKTGKAAADAGKSVSQSGAAMRAAFQATGGSIQVAGGIAQTAKAFAELNVAAAAFGSSRALLEIGKTVQDFKELGATVGKTSSIFATLGMIVKANPLLTIATVLGSVGSLMSIFADNTKQATENFKELSDAMQRARLDEATKAALGLPSDTRGRATVVEQAMSRSLAGQQFNLQAFGPTSAGGIGYGAEAARYLAQQGSPQQQAAAREYLRTGGNRVTRGYAAGMQGVEVTAFERGLPSIQLSPEQTQAILRSIYQQIVETSQKVAADTSQIYQFGAGGAVERQLPGVMGLPTEGRALATAGYQTNLATGELLREYQTTAGQAPYYIGAPQPSVAAQAQVSQPAPLPPTVAPGQAPYYLGGQQMQGVYEFGAAGPEGGALQESAMNTFRQRQEADQRAVEASRVVADNLELAADRAASMGGQLGTAFADVILKTTTLRQAFASLVASLARQSLQDVGAQIFKGVVKGATERQQSQNAGIDPGQLAPNE